MNGAESLINALAEHGVDACFANPGTSEMQLVAALDKQPDIRAVLCLFEGVVTGAADGYGRMADKPALNLLHLGPGFANGMANLHNAQRAGSPILNMVGDHATDHLNTMRRSQVISKAWPHPCRAAFAFLAAQRGWRKPVLMPSRTVSATMAPSAPLWCPLTTPGQTPTSCHRQCLKHRWRKSRIRRSVKSRRSCSRRQVAACLWVAAL